MRAEDWHSRLVRRTVRRLLTRAPRFEHFDSIQQPRAKLGPQLERGRIHTLACRGLSCITCIQIAYDLAQPFDRLLILGLDLSLAGLDAGVSVEGCKIANRLGRRADVIEIDARQRGLRTEGRNPILPLRVAL